MDPAVAEATKGSLGALIKKPPLTDKLLGKPPFRFLHDILTEIIKHHKFFEGLYSPEEMVSANVKERDAKIAFLQKAVDCVAHVTGRPPACKPSKIVAGHEPERTNEFLQQMAAVISAKKSSVEAVALVLAGKKPSGKPAAATSAEAEPAATAADEKKREKRSKPKASSEHSGDPKGKPPAAGAEDGKDKRHQGRDGKKDDEHKREKREKRSKDGKSSRDRRKDDSATKSNESIGATPSESGASAATNASAAATAPARPSSAKGGRRRALPSESDMEVPGEAAASATPADTENSGQRPSRPGPEDQAAAAAAAKPAIVETKTAVEEDPGVKPAAAVEEEHLKPPVHPGSGNRVSRPSTARPAPPKLRSRQNSAEESISRAGSSRPVAAPVIVDDKQEDDDDDTFVTEQVVRPVVDVPEVTADLQDPSEHGALVAKILSTQKKLEGSGNDQSVPAEKAIILDAQRQKERERTKKEIEKLRGSVQTLCRSANPLAKMVDYVQEDMDSMQKELESWKKANRKYAMALQHEEEVTEQELQPLNHQLEDLETEMSDQLELIGLLKANVFKNDEQIEQLVSSIAFASKQ